jgi:L-ascorbate metabolism protein UlaG (beta-lactamase superfamily)
MSATSSIQLLGHATFKVITPEGKVIIVDPWLIDNPFIPEACRKQEKIDLLLITHGHEDHFDIAIKDIIQQTSPRIIANNACRWWLIEQGVDSGLIEPINLGGTVAVSDVSITMVPAFHQSHIYVTDTSITSPHMANGFILRLSDGHSIYFAGDTALFGDMQLIGDFYKPSIAVLPVGGRYTMGPAEAAHAVKLIGAKTVIPFHYGTFSSLIPTADEFVALVTKNSDTTVQVLKAGDILELSG